MNQEALRFHSSFPKGKVGVAITKDLENNLSLAYSPGVAEPCIQIDQDITTASKYTNLSNSVAIISNGTAVLGLGKLKPIASKPVMEGKAGLFKLLAGIDCIDIEIDQYKPEELITTIAALSVGFGGINLEDIAAPECFEVEDQLKAKLDIPVFHDDQHGTAIVSSAAVLNWLELTNKSIDQIKLVCLGAGAAGLACLKLMKTIGLPKENITVFDTKGSIHIGRSDLNKYKSEFAVNKDISIEEALTGADVFLGTSAGGAFKPDWLKGMNENPLILALANPIPEIYPHHAKEVRQDVIICTGRSDLPNQVNNVLCFPYLFRIALDVGVKIDDKLKLAAVKAIAKRAKAQPGYGREQLLPKSTNVSNRFLMPGLILEQVNPETDIHSYNRTVARRLLPLTHTLLSSCANYISVSEEVDSILNGWGCKKLEDHKLEVYNLQNIKNSIAVLIQNNQIILVASDDLYQLASWVGKSFELEVVIKGDPASVSATGYICKENNQFSFYYNQSSFVGDLTLLSSLCSSVLNGPS
jgi:malate dehydrogenase (oxaloacetate-decarboxylating)(NADP+)